MATKSRDDWQADFAGLTTDPDFQALGKIPGAQEAERWKFFRNRVQMSPQYQRAPLETKKQIETQIVGDMAGGLDATAPAAGLQPAGPAPEPTPRGFPPEADPFQPNVRGALAAAPAPGRLSEMAQGALAPGGIASPEVLGMTGGGMLGSRAGMAYPVLGPMTPAVGDIAGSTLGAMAGRMTEMYQDPNQRPADFMGGMEDVLGAGYRGAKASLIGQTGSAIMNKVGGRLLRPTGKGPLSEPKPSTITAMQTAQEFDTPISAAQATGSKMLSKLEEFPQRLPFGGGKLSTFFEEQSVANEKALLQMAEQKSPGVSREMSTVGKATQNAIEARGGKAQAAVSALYNHAKDIVGEGNFSPTNLGNYAGGISQVLESPVNQVLKGIGYEANKLYTFPELLTMKQLLGNEIRNMGNKTIHRELVIAQAALGQDLVGAATQAGAAEAIPVLQRANDFYFKHIVKTFNDPDVLRTLAKRPSLAASMYLQPKAPVEAIDALRRAAGPKQFAEIGRAWYENLAAKASPGGVFNASRFAESVRLMSPEKLKAITRGQAAPFGRLMELFRHEGQGMVAPGSTRASLSAGQIFGILAGGAASSTGIPWLISSVLTSDVGIRYLTIGMKARAGSAASAHALARLAGIAATRPSVEQATGRMGAALGTNPGAQLAQGLFGGGQPSFAGPLPPPPTD